MFDLVAWMESRTDAGLEGIAPAAGGSDGYLISGDELKVKGDTDVLAVLGISAAIANWVEASLEHTDDVQADRFRSTGFVRDQTGANVPWAAMRLRAPKGASLVASANHGANAQIAAMLAILVPSGQSPALRTGLPPADFLPADCRWIQATGVTAAVASTWVQDIVTYHYKWNTERKYSVYGIAGHSPTGYAFRLVNQVPGSTMRPGWALCDTAILQEALYSSTPLITFPGTAPPQVQKLCSSTDSTTSRYALLIREE